MKIKLNNQVFYLKPKLVSRFSLGLSFGLNRHNILLWDFGKNVNYKFSALFVFSKFLIIWLDKKNKVIDFKIASPFETFLSSKKGYFKVIEVPFSNRYKKIIKIFVEKGKI